MDFSSYTPDRPNADSPTGIETPGNILHMASKSIVDSNRQAQAGASEFLRNPMGGTDSYMKGFNDPQDSETFANQGMRQYFERNPESASPENTIPAFLNTLPMNVGGSMVDTALNPLQAASTAAIGKYAEPVMSGIGKGAGFVGKGISESPFGKAVGGAWNKTGEIFGSGKNLKNVEGQLGNLENRTQELGRAKDVAQAGLEDSATTASQTAKDRMKRMVNTNAPIYGQEVDKIEQGMVDSGAKLSKSGYLENVVNKTLKDAEDMGLPQDHPTLNKIRDIGQQLQPGESDSFSGYQRLTSPELVPEETADNVGIKELINHKNSVYKKITAGARSGAKPYQPEDDAGALFQENHANYLSSQSEDLANLNKEYAPYAQAKKFGYKTFKPGAGEETQKGADVLKKIASGNYKEDDLNYLTKLEQGSGRFEGTGNLRGQTTSYANQIRDIDFQLEGLKGKQGNLLQQASRQQELLGTRNHILAKTAERLGIGGGAIAGYKFLTKT